MSNRPNESGGVAAQVERLRRLLETQLDGHRRLRGLIRRKREAIRVADLEAMTALCEQERAVAGEVHAAERQRVDLIGRLTERLAPAATAPLTLPAIGAAAPPAQRQTLEALAEALRAEVRDVRRESAIVAGAAQALSRHVAGIVQSVNGALSRVGVYERRGRIALGSQTEFCVDLKS